MINQITKASVSFDTYFEDLPTGGEWKGLPNDLQKFLQDNESSLRGITEYLFQNEHYTVTITIEKK